MPSIQQENTSNNNSNNNNNNNTNVVVYPKLNCPLAKISVNGVGENPVYRNELNGPIYEVFHLLSFPVRTPKQGILRAEDGIRKLRILERTQGIWTMDCDLQIDRKYIVLYDKRTGHEVELIPIDLVFEPTSIVSEDGNDLYNNVFLFTSLEDPKRNEPAEMHIFQCIRNHSAELVDEILKRKEGMPSNYLRLAEINKRQHKINPTLISQMNATESYRQQKQQQISQPFDSNYNYQMRKNEQRNLVNELIPNEHHQIKPSATVDNALTAEQDLQTLNSCFDDIEKFVAHLNKVTSVLEVKSKSKKSSKKSKKDNENLNWPSQQQYQDVLQTFKTSINLLAKLKGRIHNPNAPELVHFLFTPLTIILNGKSDTQFGKDIAKTVWSPLFTKEAKDLLQNCLTSKQVDIWQSLGEAWTMTKEKTKTQPPQQIPQQPHSYPHTTVFYNGQSQNTNDQHKRDVINVHGAVIHSVSPITDTQQKKIQIAHKNTHKPPANNQGVSTIAASMQHRRDEEMKNWAMDLLAKGLKVLQVIHDRQGNNEKELTVKTGEFVEVLDDRKNWWRVRNVFGQVGHIPHTILQPFDPLVSNKHH